jgi:3-dehydroquinate synthase
MKTVDVALGERSYPIFIGTDVIDDPGLIVPYLAGSQVMVVSNETIAPLYLDRIKTHFSDHRYAEVILPDGEEFKTLGILDRIFDALLRARFDRRCTLVALGGGVVGDMTGFAAAVYQRGVAFIQIPTTLLAQVDSSVGGKTGVNHPLGKNMIGAFHQPRCVVTDTATLETLDQRQLSAGLAEVIKYGLIQDYTFFEWLELNMDALVARDPVALAYAIDVSCRDKAEVVAADERESGVRALLNLGHTFGHAIETGMGYGAWLHGEAVGAGMAMAADLSERMGWLGRADVERIYALLKRASLPIVAPAELGINRFQDLMSVDKKVIDGTLRLVLLKGIGKAMISDGFSMAALVETLTECRAA